MKLKEIAGIIRGEIKGDPELDITGVSGIFDAKTGDITFISSPKYIKEIGGTAASCIIVNTFVDDTDMSQVRVQDPHLAFVELLEHFYVKPETPSGVSPLAFVSESATIGKDVSIHPFSHVSDGASIGDGSILYPGVFIGSNSTIGNDALLYPNVVIRENVKIGDRVRIHPGVVIGADGFGYIQQDGHHRKIPQVGGVVIGDDVEIGANTTIDRATTGNTVVGAGTKIDNLVQIGHNVKIGLGCIIVAQVALGGSARLGNGVVLGGQVAVADHSEIEDGAMFAGKSGVHGRVKRGVYSGIPAIDHRTWLRASSLYSRLPEMHNEIKELRKKIAELERRQQA